MGKETPLTTDQNLPPFNNFDAKISRRNFLKLSGLSLVALGVGTELQTHTIGILAEQIKDQNIASLDNNSFIDINKHAFSNVELGCSFAPEQFGLSLKTIDDDTTSAKLDYSLQALNYAVKDLGIKKIRLGIRWNNSVNQNGNLDFRLYEPFFNYCLENNVDICLNTGIKVLRWPEDHIPDLLTKDIPAKHSVIYPQSNLAQESLNHTYDLFNYLQQGYGNRDIEKITTIQPENEPFDGFGKHDLKMDPEYLKEFINLCLTYFPNSNILINSINPSVFDRISRTFSSINKNDPQIKGELISGYDYYPNHPKYPVIPIVGTVDAISLSKIQNGDLYTKQIKESIKQGVKIEITEGQAEPWGNIKQPGNSAKAFRFMVQRSTNHVLSPREKSVIRIWGIEYLANIALSGHATKEHEQIFDLIQNINHA